MSYRVCIPCAGTGSRLGGLTQFLNKSLVSIANRPTISHLIEQFQPDVEFVIALGYKGHLIREFLELAYPQRQFFFAEVFPFAGPDSGLGLSMQTCKQYLQQPFIFSSCDTLVEESIPSPDTNWMGYAEVEQLEAYRTLNVSSGCVHAIVEKGEACSGESKAYIGLAGIHNYQEFWIAMEHGGQTAIETGEAYGMRSLLLNNIKAQQFTWHDTGNPISLAQTRNLYNEPDQPNILEKVNEAIWFIGDTVIKFSNDQKFISNRVKRVAELKQFVPEVTGSTPHMYRYAKAQGKVVSEVVNMPMFERLLIHCMHFWQTKSLKPFETSSFQESCMKFYRDKTFERVAMFYKNFGREDGIEMINGKPMPQLETLLDSIDWNWLANGLPGRFHGDFHFENILYSEHEEKFVFLDWRQDFGGDLSIGDIYYDFAKLLHGLIISHELIAGNFFRVDWDHDAIGFDFHRKQSLVECEKLFGSWLVSNGYDRKKVQVLTALIFLNISPLHHHPYSLLLYSLGKSMLKLELDS